MTFVKMLLSLSAGGALLGVFLMILRRVAGGKLSNRFFYYAWLLVLLRFILPVHGLMPVRASAPERVSVSVHNAEVTQQYAAPGVYNASPAQDAPAPAAEERTERKSIAKSTDTADLLTAVWLCGGAAAFAVPAVSYFRFSRSLRASLRRAPAYESAVYSAASGRRRPRLAKSAYVHTPITIGVFSPVLVLPDTEYDEAMLRNIFAHELTHFRRRDIARKWLTLAVFAAHWFNPLVYLFRRELDALCELSCDETVIREMGRAEKQEYGETLISVAQDAPKLPNAMATGMTGEKENLKERLIQIMKYRKKGKFAIIAAVLAALILVGCGAALGPSAGTESAKAAEISDVDALLAAIAPGAEIRLAPGTYNLTEAKTYGDSAASKYYRWNDYGIEGQYELDITGVESLRISGEGAEIVTVPRMANVMSFSSCSGVELSGLTVGHTEAAEACEGGVIFLNGCKNFSIDACSLYGCGTIGVNGYDCEAVSVTNTDIHHCSAGGVDFSQSKNISVGNCRVYDCGKNESYYLAASIFAFSGVEGANVRDCEVYNSNARGLVQAWEAKDAVFDALNVHDNHFASVFIGTGLTNINGLVFTSNSVDKWYDYDNGVSAFSFDGKGMSEQELSEKYADQLSSAGVGAVEAEYAEIDRAGASEVHVSTADEFIAALASDTVIYIDVPQINLMDAAGIGGGASERFDRPEFAGEGWAWRNVYDGFELCIGKMKNLHIVGGEIVTEPRYANVLSFYDCSGISLEGTKLGHTKEQGQCAGGVVYLDGSKDIIIESCDLYGCGILGIETHNVSGLHVQNTLIHDCTLGAAMLSDSQDVIFLGCAVSNCPDPQFTVQNCTGFSWEKKLMDRYAAFNVSE